jgi:CheY-like chemotaxis protein
MVYGFVTQLKGQVRLGSEPGQGTTVRLYLPKAAAGEAPVESFNEDMKIVSGSEKILLVEDHELVRKQVSAQLAELGYQVIGAADGWQALDLLKSTTDFDLLFTDILMPRGLNGRDLAREAVRLHPDLPVLFTSGYPDQALGDEDLADPNFHLLTKPYRRETLAAKIRTVLDSPPNGKYPNGAH